MGLVSLCPLPAALLVWQPAPSRHALTVICKATYELAPGTSPLAREQEPINEHENHWDDDPNRSLYAPTDLVPCKPRGDVLLVGSAYAQGARPVRSLVVRMIVGAVDKSIEVFCPRLRTRDGEIREGKRWTKMPLLYEHAACGPERDNPVGIDRDGPRDVYGQVQLPNLQPPGLHVTDDEAIETIGFGPIAASWPPRRRKLPPGAGDEGWARAPFGEGFDPAYFQAAPLDQRVDAIRSNERITLENLHPKHLRLVTSLPDVAPRALHEAHGSPSREILLVADTLWIDTHRSICTVTYRGRLDIESAEQEGRILVALGKGNETLHWAKIAPPPASTRRAPAPPPPPSQQAQSATPEVELKKAGELSDDDIESPLTEELPASRKASSPEIEAPLTEELPAPANASSSELDVTDLLEAIEITQSEAPARASGGAGSTPRPLLPFQPAPPGYKPPAAITSGLSPRTPDAKDSAHSTQKLGSGALRAALPAWLEASAPPPAAVAPPASVRVLLRGADEPAPFASAAEASSAAAAAPPKPAPLAPAISFRPATPPLVTSPVRADGAPPAPPMPISSRGEPAPPISEGSFSVLEASNAAAGATAHPPSEPSAARRIPVTSTRVGPASAAQATVTAVELLWFDPAVGPRLAQHPSFAAWKRAAPDPAPAPAPPDEDIVRAHVHAALYKASPSSARDLESTLEPSEDDTPPAPALVLLSGDLDLCLDETEMLKAVISAATPLASTDKKLKETIDLAVEMLKTPLQGMPEVAERLHARIREAWTKVNRLLPANYIHVCTERLLLEQRLYQTKDLLDDTWIRALLTAPGAEAPIPTYLPLKIARRLPLFKRFPARLLAEPVWQQDQYETCAVALRVLALGRLVPRARARSGKAPPGK